MTTVKEIEQAIEHLPEVKLAEFRSWFMEFDAAQWDKQFERDVQSGKLDALAKKALEQLDANRCTEL